MTLVQQRTKRVSRYVIVAFYLIAGFNHFINPEFYYPLIPDYLPLPRLINILSGVLEIMVAVGFIQYRTRWLASFVAILMLVAFIPSHIYFIQLGGCVPDGLCTSLMLAWGRLLVIHPLLIGWSYWHRH